MAREKLDRELCEFSLERLQELQSSIASVTIDRVNDPVCQERVVVCSNPSGDSR